MAEEQCTSRRARRVAERLAAEQAFAGRMEPGGTWRSTRCTGGIIAEERFPSRRAGREAERLAAEQAVEAREVPGQSDEAQRSRADLLRPRPPRKPDAAPGPAAEDGA